MARTCYIYRARSFIADYGVLLVEYMSSIDLDTVSTRSPAPMSTDFGTVSIAVLFQFPYSIRRAWIQGVLEQMLHLRHTLKPTPFIRYNFKLLSFPTEFQP